MRDLLPIHKAIEFIESHLCEDVTVADMANVAGYSLYHFIRTFNQVVRHTPYDYLMRRRMAEAAYQLVASNRRVVEIALDYRFNNHESFSRAFKRLFGMQAIQWRERGALPHRVLMPAFTYAYLEHINLPGFQRPKQTICHQRYLAGLMTSLKGHSEEPLQLWRVLGNLVASYKSVMQENTFFGITSYFDEQEEQSFYFAGFETKHLEQVMPVLASQILPATDYICLAHEAPLTDLPLTLTYLYHTWLPKAGFKPAFTIEVIAFGTTPPWLQDPAEVVLWLPVKNVGNVPSGASPAPVP